MPPTTAKNALPILIVQTGSAIEPARKRWGDFPHWLRLGMGVGQSQVRVLDARTQPPLPHPWQIAGVVVTGSASMVTEKCAWSTRTGAWLCDAVAAEVPVLGVCYGHQLLAQALGGEVGYNPKGREIGSVTVRLLPGAADDPLLGGPRSEFLAHATHQQSVLSVPPGAVALAHSDLDPCQAFRAGNCAWGVQFHPEFSTRIMHTYLRARWDTLREEGHRPERLLASVSATPHARQVLRRFARWVATRP